MINTLCIFGTRPEAIKMAPIIKLMKSNPLICNKVCVTGQHQVMLNSVLNLFEICPDFNLHIMEVNQSLGDLTAKILYGLGETFKHYKPDLVLVHGDTMTTLAASLSAYLILTDSGGVQEEAPALGKPVLVMRETTERPEVIKAGAAKLIGTGVEQIVESVASLLSDALLYQRMSTAQNPYGDGQASQRIVKIITALNELPELAFSLGDNQESHLYDEGS